MTSNLPSILNDFRAVAISGNSCNSSKENKKFQLSKIDKKARSREYMGCITWLEDAGVISVCYCLQYPELPLKGNHDDSKFKIYYPDTGLLIASLDEEAQEDLRAKKNLGVYKGALYENFVAEAFVKQGLGLYYYKKENATLEEDFFVRTKDELVPVDAYNFSLIQTFSVFSDILFIIHLDLSLDFQSICKKIYSR